MRRTNSGAQPFVALVAFLIGSSSFAGPVTEMPVTLFGQSCVLQGPVEQSVLKAIHSVSPEQLYPDYEKRPFKDLGEQVRKALDSLKKAQGLPPALDRYREKLGKRWQAQLAFFEGIEGFKTSKKAAPFLSSLGAHLQAGKNKKAFEALAKKMDGKSAELAKASVLDQLFESYNETIEPDPEDDFHKGIHRMSVQYNCAMEEGGEAEEAE